MNGLSEFFSNHLADHWLWWLFWTLFFFFLGWLFSMLKWKSMYTALETKYNALTKTHATLQTDYDGLKSKYTELEAELSRANKEIEDLNARIRKLENEKGQLYGDLQTSKDEILKVNNLITAVQADKASVDGALKVAISDNDANTAEIARLKAELEKAKNAAGSVADAEKEIARLKAELAKAKEAAGNAGAASEENAKLKAEIDRLNAELARAKESAGSAGANSDKEIAGLMAQISQLNTDLGIANNAAGNAGAASEENARLKAEIDRLNAELAKAKGDLNAANQNAGDDEKLKAQIASLQSEKDQLSGSLNSTKAALQKCQDSKPTAPVDDGKADLLQAVEGIGPKMEEVLNKNGIKTFAALGRSNKADLDAMLEKAGYSAGISDTGSWVEQASAGAAEEWQKMHDLQLDEGGGSIAKIDKFLKKLGIEDKITHHPSENFGGSSGGGGKDTGKPDLLQAIEGVGPKMEGALNKNGIKTFSTLSKQSKNGLDEMLEKAGYNPGISDTQSWIDQARLASAGKWQEMHDMQLDEGGGSIAKIDKFEKKLGITLVHHEHDAPKPAAEPAKLTKEEKEAKAAAAADKLKSSFGSKIPKATADQKDDLKLISGVGPFIEEKLNKLGIYTFEQVSKFDQDLIDTVTDAIQFFPGRISRDNWVGQAGQLFKDKTS